MDKKVFFGQLKAGVLTNSEILRRLEQGDISRSDLNKNAKGVFDMRLQNEVNAIMDKRAFTGMLKKLEQPKGECLDAIKNGIDAGLHSPESISLFNEECMKYFIEKTTKGKGRALSSDSDSDSDVEMTEVARPRTDSELLAFMEYLDNKESMSKLSKKLEGLNIKTKRQVQRKKNTEIVTKKTKVTERPSLYSIKRKTETKKPMKIAKFNKSLDKLLEQIKRENQGTKKKGPKAKAISPVSSRSSVSVSGSRRSSMSDNSIISSRRSSRSVSGSTGSFVNSPTREAVPLDLIPLGGRRRSLETNFKGVTTRYDERGDKDLYVPEGSAYTMKIKRRRI